MRRVLLPQVDLIESYGQLAFNLDFYTEVQDLGRLVYSMDLDRFGRRFQKLSSGLCEARSHSLCTQWHREPACSLAHILPPRRV